MTSIYKSPEGERQVRERYLAFLKHWPVPHQQFRIPTSQGETFVIASGPESAPALFLFHGGIANSVMWMAEVPAYASHFRVYSVDLIGEPGLSAPSRPSIASDAYALWLDDVFKGLAVERASLVGISLGGWLALDYATRRPERIERVAVMCPAGVGRQKLGIVFATLVLSLCGRWGKRKLAEKVLGRAPANPAPPVKAFLDFFVLIRRHFRPRMVKFRIFSEDALRKLTMPILAIVGGKDVLLDSAQTRSRLERYTPHAEVVYLAGVGHLITGQTGRIIEFLRRGPMREIPYGRESPTCSGGC